MGGAWVFPGGAVDRDEGQGDARPARRRHPRARGGGGDPIADPGQLVPFSRWITPAEVKIRFDTWFYLAPAPPGARGAARRQRGGRGALVLRRPRRSRRAHRGELFLVFPTIKHLEQLSGFASADELLAHARGREIHPVQPRVFTQGETARIVLPGEPGYAELTRRDGISSI